MHKSGEKELRDVRTETDLSMIRSMTTILKPQSYNSKVTKKLSCTSNRRYYSKVWHQEKYKVQ